MTACDFLVTNSIIGRPPGYKTPVNRRPLPRKIYRQLDEILLLPPYREAIVVTLTLVYGILILYFANPIWEGKCLGLVFSEGNRPVKPQVQQLPIPPGSFTCVYSAGLFGSIRHGLTVNTIRGRRTANHAVSFATQTLLRPPLTTRMFS